MPDADAPLNLTPYQGTRKCYGFFECEDCPKKWTSKHSWANTSQKCHSCLKFIYPCRQLPFEEGEKKKKKEDGPAHPVNSCGKCIKLGRSCTRMLYSPNTDDPAPEGRRRNRRRRRRARAEE